MCVCQSNKHRGQKLIVIAFIRQQLSVTINVHSLPSRVQHLCTLYFGSFNGDLIIEANQTLKLNGIKQKIFEYNSIIIRKNATLTLNPNAKNGGTLSILCKGDLYMESGAKITMSGRGYHGRHHGRNNASYIQKTNAKKMDLKTRKPNIGGGGAGQISIATENGAENSMGAGALHIYGTKGINGAGALHGYGGLIYGNNTLSVLHLGSGGGSIQYKYKYKYFDDKFANIKYINNNRIQIPKFTLKTAKIYAIKPNNRYKIKLNWDIENECMINDNNINFYYKNNDNIWIKCANYKLYWNSNDKYIELNELFLFDNIYSFKIEYIINEPFSYKIISNIKICSFKNNANANAIKKLQLIYCNHRGYYLNNHPNNLLFNDNTYYKSQINNKFVYNKYHKDYDWIIFRYNNNFIPSKFYIKNSDNESGVKKMIVCIGDIFINQMTLMLNVDKENKYLLLIFQVLEII